MFKRKRIHTALTEQELQQRMIEGNSRMMQQMREQQDAELRITEKDLERQKLLRKLMGDRI